MDKDAILRAAGIDGDMLRELQVGPKPLFVRFHFSLPVAQRFSDLTGIKTDLEAVEKICGRLIAEKTSACFAPRLTSGYRWTRFFLRCAVRGSRCALPAHPSVRRTLRDPCGMGA